MLAALFIIYFLILGYCLTRVRIIKNCGIPVKTIYLLYTIKIAAGFAVCLASHFLLHDKTDYHSSNNYGLSEYNSMLHTPKIFFTDLFTSNYADKGEFFGSKESYWNDLRFNIIYKIIAFLNIFSRGNIYINTLFFNFFSFISLVLLYKVFNDIYPNRKKEIIVGCFLLPSTLYFGSGLHKDLIVLLALSIFCYILYFGVKNGFNTKRVIYLALSFLTILFIRNFIAVLLLPCALTWALISVFKLNPIKSFGVLVILGLIGTFILQSISKKVDPLNIVVKKQQAFFNLETATTEYQLDSLQPTFISFTKNAPSALRHSFLSPYPTEFKNFFMQLFSAEMIAYWCIFFAMLVFPVKQICRTNTFIYFGLFFVFIVFLFTGYITTAAGSLIRYRSIYFPFLIIPLLANIKLPKSTKK